MTRNATNGFEALSRRQLFASMLAMGCGYVLTEPVLSVAAETLGTRGLRSPRFSCEQERRRHPFPRTSPTL